VPLEVYRCLVKMAFAVLPDHELRHFERTRQWLLEELGPPFLVLASMAFSHIAFLPDPLPAPRITLWRRRNGSTPAPYILATVGFSRCIFMYGLPLSTGDGHLAPGRFRVPTFDLARNADFLNAKWGRIALHLPMKESSLEHTITLAYDGIEEITPEVLGEPPVPEQPMGR
jgi:hypothetical protein